MQETFCSKTAVESDPNLFSASRIENLWDRSRRSGKKRSGWIRGASGKLCVWKVVFVEIFEEMNVSVEFFETWVTKLSKKNQCARVKCEKRMITATKGAKREV